MSMLPPSVDVSDTDESCESGILILMSWMDHAIISVDKSRDNLRFTGPSRLVWLQARTRGLVGRSMRSADTHCLCSNDLDGASRDSFGKVSSQDEEDGGTVCLGVLKMPVQRARVAVLCEVTMGR